LSVQPNETAWILLVRVGGWQGIAQAALERILELFIAEARSACAFVATRSFKLAFTGQGKQGCNGPISSRAFF